MLDLMKSDLEQIEDRARTLSAEERAKLAESMLESLHEPLADVESAWAEEIERRLASLDTPRCSDT
jgi:putative addiction module component (TIGR02574 family)